MLMDSTEGRVPVQDIGCDLVKCSGRADLLSFVAEHGIRRREGVFLLVRMVVAGRMEYAVSVESDLILSEVALVKNLHVMRSALEDGDSTFHTFLQIESSKKIIDTTSDATAMLRQNALTCLKCSAFIEQFSYHPGRSDDPPLLIEKRLLDACQRSANTLHRWREQAESMRGVARSSHPQPDGLVGYSNLKRFS